MQDKIINHLIEGLQEDQLIEELKSDGEEIFNYEDSEWYVSFFKEKWVAWELKLIGLEQEKLGKIKFFDTKFEAVIDQLKLGIQLLGKEDIDKYVIPGYISVLEVAKEIFERESEGEEIDVFEERDILLGWLISYSQRLKSERLLNEYLTEKCRKNCINSCLENIIKGIPDNPRSAIIIDFEESRKKKMSTEE